MTLRSLGDVVDGVTTARLDPPAAAAIKGSPADPAGAGRAPLATSPRTPRRSSARSWPAGRSGSRRSALDRVRSQVLRPHQRNHAADAALQAAGRGWRGPATGRATRRASSWTGSRPPGRRGVHGAVVAPAGRRGRCCCGWPTATACPATPPGCSPARRSTSWPRSMQAALDTGTWSVADVALIDDLAARLGLRCRTPRRGARRSTRSRSSTTSPVTASPRCGQRYDAPQGTARGYEVAPHRARASGCCAGGSEAPAEYAHVLVDEAQDLSPMQWRMLGRRGR